MNHFRKADANHNGLITVTELKNYYKTVFNKNFSQAYLENLISTNDQDGDTDTLNYKGKIKISNFLFYFLFYFLFLIATQNNTYNTIT